MRFIGILSLLVVGLLLLAGCTNTQEESQTGDQGPSNQPTNQPTQVPVHQGNQEPVTGNENQNLGQNQEPVQEEEVQQNHNQNLDEMTWAALMSLGQPIKCEYEYKAEEGTTHGTVYIKGDNVRVEMDVEYTSPSEGPQHVVYISKEDGVYLKLDKSMFKDAPEDVDIDCEWIHYPRRNVPQENTEVDTGVDTDVDALESNIRDPEMTVDYHCEVGNFGDEKFEPDGKVCTFEELLQMQMPAGYQ